jgi:O-antigen/teichoic acid export membrane protein
VKYFRQFSVYTLVGFFGAGISFLLMPYLSYFLKPAEYGILSMVNSVVTILIPLIGLTAAGIISVEYYKQKDKKEFASLFSSVQFIPIIPFLFLIVMAILLADPVARFLEIPVQKSYWIPLSCVIALLTIYFETLTGYNVTEQKPGYFAFFNILKIVTEVTLTILFITQWGYGWEGRLYAWLISSLVLFLAGFIYFRKQYLLSFSISKKYIRTALLFGLPLILHVVGKFVINQSDRVFITKMVSIDEAGIYNIGYQVGMIMLLLVNAMGNFMQPFLFERLASLTESAKRQIVKTSYVIIGSLLIILVVITVATPTFFTWLVDESYAKGTRYVFWVGLSYFFWGVYIIFAGYIFYSGKTGILGVLAIVNVVLNILLNYFLIKAFGPMGAAYATCISFFVVSVIIVWKANRLYPLPWLRFNFSNNR